MPSSLDALSQNLPIDQFKISKKYYKNDQLFMLIKKKGIYPYEYMYSFKKI